MSIRWSMVHALALASLGLGGCAYGELHQVLRAQVASELSCPEVDVEKKGLSYLTDEEENNRYLVTGCGVTRTYTCPEGSGLVSYDEPVCSFEAGNTDQPKVAEMPDEVSPLDEELPAEQPAEATEAEPTKPAAEATPAAPAKAEPEAATKPEQ